MCISIAFKCGSSWYRSLNEFEIKICHSYEINFYFIAREVPEDQPYHKPRAKTVSFQLEIGVIEARLGISTGLPCGQSLIRSS